MSAQPLSPPSTAPATTATVGEPGGVLLAGPPASSGAESHADHVERLGALPYLSGDGVEELAVGSGLTGRGGGHFPFARKLAAVRRAAERQGRAPLVVINASESEPACRKDRTLLRLRPHLVLDGAALAAAALGAAEVVLHVHAGDVHVVPAARQALAERSGVDGHHWRLSTGPGGYVSGESSAVVRHLEGGPALPRGTSVPVAESGVGGRPTLLANAETFAHLAVLARTGPTAWRERGAGPWGGPALHTLHGAVTEPGRVVEVVGRVTMGELLTRHAGLTRPPAAVLVGGYAGTWLPGALAWRTEVDRAALTAAGASPGCGLLLVLDHSQCGLRLTASLAQWLAGQTAGQCGPCVFGLPELADRFTRVADGTRRRSAPEQVTRLTREVNGRGGCRHPDGVVRLVRSALSVFADDVDRHVHRRPCPASSAGPAVPLPPSGGLHVR